MSSRFNLRSTATSYSLLVDVVGLVFIRCGGGLQFPGTTQGPINDGRLCHDPSSCMFIVTPHHLTSIFRRTTDTTRGNQARDWCAMTGSHDDPPDPEAPSRQGQLLGGGSPSEHLIIPIDRAPQPFARILALDADWVCVIARNSAQYHDRKSNGK